MSCNGRYSGQSRYGNTLAPVRIVRFINPVYTTQFVDRESLIDSGASGTMIPKDIAEKLALIEIRKSDSYDYEGNFTGRKSVYVVTVSCDNLSHNVEALETNGIPIIGRDILNTLQLTLRGPQQRWEMG